MPSCDCINIDNAEDGPECCFKTRPIARKEHKCFECGRTINIGEEYICESGKWDGRFRVYKTCVDCLSVRDEMFCQMWEYANIWGDVKEYLRDIDYEISEDCLLALTPYARNMVCDIIDEAWEEEEL